MNSRIGFKVNKMGMLVVTLSIVIVACILVYSGVVWKNSDEKLSNNKGFEDIESIEIRKLEYGEEQPKIKWRNVIDETEEIKSIVSILDKKEELLNQYYCAIVYNKLIINNKDGNSIEYGLLIGEKVITIYDGDLRYRIEDENASKKFKGMFEDVSYNTINVK